MKKNIVKFMVIVLCSQIVLTSFSFAKTDNSSKQDPVCSAPWETMRLYLEFQNDAINAILWADVDDMRFQASLSTHWLFTDNILPLWQWSPAALDLAANNTLWKTRSLLSAWATTVVLLWLTAASTVQWGLEWLSILFESRPIVREYKSLLDIETRLMNAAYYYSDKVSLTRPLDSDLYKRLWKVIDKYRWLWLLDWSWTISSNVSLNNVILALLTENASMKSFVANWWIWGGGGLWKFCSCMWKCTEDNCGKNNAVLKFTDEAVSKLVDEYSWVRLFTNCDVAVSSFKNTISNTSKIWSTFKDAKDALDRLWNSLITVPRDTFSLSNKKACDDMTAYEIAQARAYYWSNWSCWEKFDVQIQIPDTTQAKRAVVDSISRTINYMQSMWQSIKDWHKEWKEDKQIRRNIKKMRKSLKAAFGGQTTEEKSQEWYDEFGTTSVYDSAFSADLLMEFWWDFDGVMEQYQMSQINASMSDMTDQLINITALIEQIDELWQIMWNDSEGVQWTLRKIEQYQCNG